jgi:HK97 family phage major capsid protein
MDTLTADAAQITKDLARAIRFAEDEKAEAAAMPDVQVGHDRAEDEPIHLGQFLQAVAFKAMPGKYDLLSPAQKAAVTGASSGASADGGVLVRTEWSTELLGKAREAAQLLPKCDNKPIGAGFDAFEAPYINETSRATGSRWGGVRVYRAAEAVEATASKPTFGKFELKLEDLKGLMYATDRLLRDATAFKAVAESAFASEFAFAVDNEILRGTGAGQSLGILNADCLVTVSKESGQANDTIKAENVIKMYNVMLARNMPRAEWYVNQECLEQLHRMSVAVGTAGGQLVYMPPSGLASAPYGSLLGRPVNVVEVASGLGDLGDIFFADFSEYLVISKPMESAESMHVRFIYDEMTFRWTWPIIGKPKLASAITPYKATTATSLSPFVTLQAR